MANAECADLEVSLTRRDAGLYAVEMRFTQPGSEADVRRRGAAIRRWCTSTRRRCASSCSTWTRTGRRSGRRCSPRRRWRRCTRGARRRRRGWGCRCGCAWRSGRTRRSCTGCAGRRCGSPAGARLVASERVQFSRYLSSADWQPVRLRPQAELRVLVAIANPAGLDAYGLAAVDVEKRVERGARGPGRAAGDGAEGRARRRWPTDRGALRGGYDVLYLVCHGTWQRGGVVAVARGRQTGRSIAWPGRRWWPRIAALGMRPRLVVLASCEGAGTGQTHGRQRARRWRRWGRAWRARGCRRCWRCRGRSARRRWRR
jgi:hypothetical protein